MMSEEKVKKKKEPKYSMDGYGWIDADIKPYGCDVFRLVCIAFENNVYQNAWWTGTIWDYGRLRSKSKIIKWRFQKDE